MMFEQISQLQNNWKVPQLEKILVHIILTINLPFLLFKRNIKIALDHFGFCIIFIHAIKNTKSIFSKVLILEFVVYVTLWVLSLFI